MKILSPRGNLSCPPVMTIILTLGILFAAIACAGAKVSAQGKVLVVMSYDVKNDSEIAIAEGLAEVLTGQEVRYFYMDTKNHLEQAAVNAEKAYAEYLAFQPDVVIAADDTAQEAFVLPYLLHKVKTPVVFCGVNDRVEQYGYPNDQVTGVIEKKHYREGIHFARLIDPRIKKIAVVYRENPPNTTNLAQIKREEKEYGVSVVDRVAVASSDQLLAALGRLRKKADALLVLNLGGITGADGKEMEVNKAMALAAKSWPKMSIAASFNEVEAGILCGVIKVNQEQGILAARMVLEILAGKSPAEIPATRNKNGQRVINAATAKRLGIKIKPMVLIGTKLVQ